MNYDEVKGKLREALAAVERAEKEQGQTAELLGAAKVEPTKTPPKQEMAELLTKALAILEYGTYMGGKYRQMDTLRFNEQAQALVPKIAQALGVKPYSSVKGAQSGQ